MLEVPTLALLLLSLIGVISLGTLSSLLLITIVLIVGVLSLAYVRLYQRAAERPEKVAGLSLGRYSNV